jgi:DNA-binding CsgD family transcriptional regulator
LETITHSPQTNKKADSLHEKDRDGHHSPFTSRHVFLSPPNGTPTELIRNYLETRSLAPAKIFDGKTTTPNPHDVVLHNGHHKLPPVKKVDFCLIVYQEGWHLIDMVFWKRRGACGWLDLQDDPQDFQQLIREALDGKSPLATPSVRPHLDQLDGFIDRKLGRHLTRRELDISVLLMKGFSDKETAKQLKISTGTVHNHRKSIYRKLGVHSISQLMHRLRTMAAPTK